jgi:hypothetical protein
MIKKCIVCFSLLISFLISISEARQGCCSHHGGVCGCGCCDGTPLSAKCAPYYDCGEPRAQSSTSNYEKEKTIQLQANLKKLGYYRGIIDGVAGKMTKEGIKSFQRDNAFEVTGIADNYTVQAIKDAAEQRD